METNNNTHNLFNILILTWMLFMVITSCNDSEANKSTTSASDTHAFTDVNVIPMDEEHILENYTVIVHEGQISEMGPASEVEVPNDAVKIDGSGNYLMPGLTEMHGHIPGPDNSQYAEDVLFLYISNGVTTVRNMAGHSYHLELRERVADNELTGPTIYAATPWLSTEVIPSPEDADEVVRGFQEEGFDHMKIGSIPLQTYQAMAETANEIGFPFAGHIPADVGLVNALEAGQASIDHYDRYGEFLAAENVGIENRESGFFGSGVVDLMNEDRIPEAVDLTIEAGTWNVPTLSLVEHLASPEAPEDMAQWPEMKYMPEDVVEGWVQSKHDFQERDDFQPKAAQRLVEIRQKLTKELHDKGAPIALGSDAPQFFNVPGFSIHHELEMMVATGLTPYEVLVTGTSKPAEYFGTPEAFGTIETGRQADLILLEANPLEDIAHVRERAGVMVRGNWWPEEKIQERLSQIAN